MSLSGFSITPEGPQITLALRTDMWRFWLADAIDAAATALAASGEIPELYKQFEAGDLAEDALDEVVVRELIASLRAISAAAFAIDAFYASIKSRSPEHPDQAAWSKKRTARYIQVSETITRHLKINDSTIKTRIRTNIQAVFEYRDKAVHPPSEFYEAVYRSDLNVGLDRAFVMFRAENAVSAMGTAVDLLDYCVARMNDGSPELAAYQQGARKNMDVLLEKYDAAGVFPHYERAT
ncbi:hypothetical protein [Mycobacterium sp. SM3041]|uniref:hypothetical protein n=1 Tax=Mycobacterium sp. SM3041 TaxID=3114291 RepID=UPI0032047122